MATIGERIIEGLGGITSTQLQEVKQHYETAVSRAYEAGIEDANDEPPSGDLRSFSYRAMGGGSGQRDYSKVDRQKMSDEVWGLWQSSPIAKRIMTLKRDHIIGRNATPQADDEELQELVDAFWSVNKLDRRVKEYCLQLFLLGEQCYPAFVRSDGAVRLGYVDPAQIEKVITHPDNATDNWAVVVALTQDDSDTPWVKGGSKKKVYRIIREDEGALDGDKVIPPKDGQAGKLITAKQATLEAWEKAMLKHYELTEYSGSCFYEKVNSVSNHPRGYSDLMQVGDWVEEAEKTLFGIADREQIASYFLIHAQVDGGPEDVEYWKNHFKAHPPKKWGINVTNKAVDLEIKTPDLKQAASIASFVALLTLIMGGVGYPLSWYGYGNDTNRATLDKQADPTEKSLEHDQDLFKDFMLTILRFVRDQAVIHNGTLPYGDVDLDLQLGEINAQNVAQAVAAFVPAVQAMIAARDNKLVSEQTAVEVVAKVLAEIGQVVDARAEMDEAEQNEIDDEEKDTERRNGQLKEALTVYRNGK